MNEGIEEGAVAEVAPTASFMAIVVSKNPCKGSPKRPNTIIMASFGAFRFVNASIARDDSDRRIAISCYRGRGERSRTSLWVARSYCSATSRGLLRVLWSAACCALGARRRGRRRVVGSTGNRHGASRTTVHNTGSGVLRSRSRAERAADESRSLVSCGSKVSINSSRAGHVTRSTLSVIIGDCHDPVDRLGPVDPSEGFLRERQVEDRAAAERLPPRI
jgi:hypothetical protein